MIIIIIIIIINTTTKKRDITANVTQDYLQFEGESKNNRRLNMKTETNKNDKTK